MSNQNFVFQASSIALLAILAAGNIPARAIAPTTNQKVQTSNDIAQNQTAIQFNQAGGAKYQAGDYQGALADYNKAIELDPKLAMGYNNRAFLKNNRLKDYQGALADYNKAIELDPKYAAAYIVILSETGESLKTLLL
jgi:tetratricopeptide (TPR) repeat protein